MNGKNLINNTGQPHLPMNTIGRDGTLFITTDGKTEYYSSDRADSKGGMDIYKLPE